MIPDRIPGVGRLWLTCSIGRSLAAVNPEEVDQVRPDRDRQRPHGGSCRDGEDSEVCSGGE